jgi:hypothetical protein
VRTISWRQPAALVLAGLAVAGGAAGCSGLIGRQDRGAFCGLLEQAFPAFQQEPLPALGPGAGASEWMAYFHLAHQRNQRLIDLAPHQLVAALTNIQKTNDQLADFYAEAEYAPDQIDRGALAQLRRDTGYQQAVGSVTAYGQRTCKIDTGH